MAKRFLSVLLVLGIMLCMSTPAFAAEGPEWSGSYTAENNNLTTNLPLPTTSERVEKQWQADVGTGTIAIADGYIYTYDGTLVWGSQDREGTLYKVDQATGEIVKELRTGIHSLYNYSATLYENGTVFVAGANGVMAVDPDSFEIKWTRELELQFSTYHPVIQYVDDCVVTYGFVFNAQTGEAVADLEGTYNFSSGAYVDGIFYVASIEGDLYAYDACTWEKLDALNFRTADTWDKLQPGVMYYEGRLYWSDYYTGHLYSVALDENGLMDEASFLKETCGIYSVCTPVAADGRVYLAGKIEDDGVVGVFEADDLQEVYIAGNATGNIMSTPILLDEAAQNTVFVQSYGAEGDNSKLYMLRDTAQIVENGLVMLVDIEPANYAYQQLAFDAEGALYCTNDAGFLIKYRAAEIPAPVFTKDLSETTVVYEQGAAAMALEVEATISEGTLSFRWQVKSEDGQWQDIDGSNTNSFTPDTQTEGMKSYRCVAVNTLYGETATATSKAITIKVLAPEPEVTEIAVTFRLIGDLAHEDKAHEEYVTWIPTTEYKNIPVGTTAYEVFQKAVTENKLDHKYDSRKGYVSAVQAPDVLGGYWLEEYDNGNFSGWMFTVNGEHPGQSAKGCVLNDGDEIIFHYVDDYTKEETSNTWLEAEDITPEEYLEGKKPVHTHTEEIIPAKAPNCTETGLTEGKKCSVCGTVTVAQNEIPAKGHTEKIVDAKEATWYAEGYTGDTYCSVCNVLIKKGSVTEKTKDQPENPFEDVEEDKFYFTPVLWAVEEGVTAGTSATTFAPEANCTRGQIVTFLWRAAGKPEPSSAEHPFTDLDEKAFYYKAVLWAVENEITKGLTDTTFGPGKECTRGQVVTFLHRFAGNVTPESQDNPFTDVKDNAFYYNAMLWAVEKDITKGISTTQFAPDKTCTRGQIVTFLFRYMTQK